MNQSNNSSLNTGFTLIEILIVISVTFILLTISYASYAQFNQRQIVISAGQNLKNTLRDVQSRAFNGEVDCDQCYCIGNSNPPLDGWYVDLNNKDFYGKCGVNEFPDPHNKLNLNSEIILSVDNIPGSVLFFAHNPPSTNIDSQGATICVSHPNLPGSDYKVTVNQAGVIGDSGGLATCP